MNHNITRTKLAQERVTVRHARVGDEWAIARLAALDSREIPVGPALVAVAGARIVAALPLRSGRPVADPFVPTAELIALLELRAAQLDRKRERRRLRGLFRTRRPATT